MDGFGVPRRGEERVQQLLRTMLSACDCTALSLRVAGWVMEMEMLDVHVRQRYRQDRRTFLLQAGSCRKQPSTKTVSRLLKKSEKPQTLPSVATSFKDFTQPVP